MSQASSGAGPLPGVGAPDVQMPSCYSGLQLSNELTAQQEELVSSPAGQAPSCHVAQ